MPKADSMEIMKDSVEAKRMMDEYNRLQCRENQMPTVRPDMPDDCRKSTFSISSIIHDGALGRLPPVLIQ